MSELAPLSRFCICFFACFGSSPIPSMSGATTYIYHLRLLRPPIRSDPMHHCSQVRHSNSLQQLGAALAVLAVVLSTITASPVSSEGYPCIMCTTQDSSDYFVLEKVWPRTRLLIPVAGVACCLVNKPSNLTHCPVLTHRLSRSPPPAPLLLTRPSSSVMSPHLRTPLPSTTAIQSPSAGRYPASVYAQQRF